MPDYRRAITVTAGFDKVFEFLADVENLPRYFDRMTSAHPSGGDKVEVTAQVADREEKGEGWFRVDRTANRIQWGTPGSGDYHGELRVRADQDRTDIEIELHTEHTADDEIGAGLDATLDHIRELLERRP